MSFIKLILSVFMRSFTSFFFMFLLMMVYWNVKYSVGIEESWVGFIRNRPIDQFLDVVLYGMIAGLLASFIIAILGITIDYKAILVIWPLALLLMLFDERYMCFSYAGGIASLSSLMFGWPKMDVSSVIALVGILHLMESMLIYMDGYKYSIPVYMEHRTFDPMGAFIMRKMWPIPLVVLVLPESSTKIAGSIGLEMPNWWPVFSPQYVPENPLVALPIVALLGYADIAITDTPKGRTKESGFWLCAYSLFILILAVVSSRIFWVKYIAAICMPILHEAIIIFSKKSQKEGQPVFTAPWRGVRVLDVFPDSHGQKMGMMQGDIVLSINNSQVNSMGGIDEILSYRPYFIWIEIKRKDKTLVLETMDYVEGIQDLGVMFVPRNTSRYFLMEERKGLIFRAWEKISVKFKKNKMA